MTSNKHVVFDVVGTCIAYDAFFEAMEARLGQRLREQNVGSRAFALCWMEAGEKECTYLSVSTTYVKFVDVFRSIFYRTLRQIGIKDPRSFASDEDREFLLAAYRSLKARPGLATCFSKLREAGFKVWCFTSGDTERVSGYLAAGGVDFPSDNFVSCDTFRISKPAPTAYQYILDKFPTENREVWFAAAHMWDAAAARRNGFKGAWVSVWEGEQCSEIFGEMEVTAHDLPGLADGIVAYSSGK